MTHYDLYAPPPPGYSSQQNRPEQTVAAKASWMIVAIWNTLAFLVWTLGLIGLVVGGAVLMRDLARSTSSEDYAIESSMAGVGIAFLIVFAVVGFVIALVFMILAWKRVWPALVVQTALSGIGLALFTVAFVLGSREQHQSGGLGTLIACWVGVALLVLFTILTSPRRAARQEEWRRPRYE